MRSFTFFFYFRSQNRLDIIMICVLWIYVHFGSASNIFCMKKSNSYPACVQNIKIWKFHFKFKYSYPAKKILFVNSTHVTHEKTWIIYYPKETIHPTKSTHRMTHENLNKINNDDDILSWHKNISSPASSYWHESDYGKEDILYLLDLIRILFDYKFCSFSSTINMNEIFRTA